MTSISLRRSIPADAEILLTWRSQPSTSRYQPILQLPLEDLRASLAARAHLLVNPASIGNFQYIALADNVPVGWISLEITEANRRHGNGVIGYTIGEEFRGRGFGRAALAEIIPIAFDRMTFNLERLEAIASVENVASCRVLESNGFQREGTLRGLLIINNQRVDHAIFGLLRSDWEKK